MCSRYSLTSPPEAVRAVFRTRAFAGFPPRYNIAPTQPVAIVRNDAKGARELALVRWGLIPPWVKEPKDFSLLVNARSETAADKPSFRGAMRHHRCLVPSNGFYEWTGKPGAKRPFLIRPRRGSNHGLMALAGIFEHWMGADGSELETMAILTTAANAVVAPLHDRMPVIIGEADFERWLDCGPGSVEPVRDLLRPADEELLEAIEVSPRVNSVRNDGPELQRPVRTTLL